MKIKLSHIRYITPILIIAIFFLPSITHAAIWDIVSDPLGTLKGAFLKILSDAILPLVTNVMSFQNFFPAGVNAGWKATRDFANLFFALILLFIAIATVLNTGGLDNYTAKRMLPKFIFAALFINFSKAIVGFLIDISQIIMISLYNSFGPTLTDSIASASKIAEAGAETNLIDSNIINLFTIILVIILIFVLLWTSLILAMRIVTLWFVIMLSPLAFVSGLIPPLSSLSNSWKNMLSQALITGPTLMFLLYLAVTVMNASIGGNSEGGNLLNNGNLLNYVLVIGLLFLANIEAMKAGQSAPPILKNAVGVAGTVATFGLGAYVGAGGYNSNQLRKKTVELADKGVGGATRGVQVLTGGKIKANSRYEAMKKDMTAANDAGKGLFGGVGQQFSQAGQKEQQEDFELKKARDLVKSKDIDNPQFKRYKGILAASQAKKATEIKEIENTEILGKQLKEATEKGYKEEAAALATRISTIKDGWSQVFGEKGAFKEYSIDYENEGEQLKAFFDKEFGPSDDENGNTVTKELKSRMIRNLEDKGGGNFASGLSGQNAYEKAGKIGVLGAGAMIAKNSGLLNKRKIDPDTKKGLFKSDGSGKADYELDLAKVYPIIASENSLDLLRDPKSWTQYNRTETVKLLKTLLENPDKYTKEVPSLDKEKVEAALIGLGDTPSKKPAGFRTS
jgi:hypothetical protein